MCLRLEPSMFSFLSFLHFYTDDFIYLQATCMTTQTANDAVPNHHEDGGVAAVAMGLVVIIVVIIIMLCHTTSTMKFDYYGY